jgi:hypothetical protein
MNPRSIMAANGALITSVTISKDGVVDELREDIYKKYSQSYCKGVDALQ